MGLLEHLEAIVQFLDADAGQQALRVELNFLQGQLLSLRQEAVEQDSGFQAPVPTRTQLTGTNGARCNLISSLIGNCHHCVWGQNPCGCNLALERPDLH